MNSRVITLAIFAIIGIPILILLGQWSATEPLYAGACALIVVGVLILFQLGSRCWLLIPFFSPFTGSLTALPGNFAPRDLSVALVIPLLLTIWVVRRFPLRIRFGAMEIVISLLLLAVAQALLRNPVGLSVLGSASVGARSYFEIGVSVMIFITLSVLIVDLKGVRWMVLAIFLGSMVTAIWESLTGLLPALAYASTRYYIGETTTLAAKQYLGLSPSGGEGSGRLIYLKLFPDSIIRLALSYHSPLQLLNPRYIGWALMIALSIACILLSGFRSGIAGMGLMVIAASLLHRRYFELAILSMIGVPLLAVLLVLQGSVFELPLSAQRALSFLPADWDDRAMVEAEGSSRWRFEMWRLALSSDRYIRNKWLGDGYGFSADEMAYQEKLQMRGIRPQEMQDYFLITGAYHSGPVETIKRIGYVGLGILLFALIFFAKASVDLVSRARGTLYFPYAVFVALPLVILPVFFILIFGAFGPAISQLLLAGGMIRLIGNSMDEWKAELRTNGAPETSLKAGPVALTSIGIDPR